MSNRRLTLPIHTARLTLREFMPSDLDAVYTYASDAEVVRFMFYEPRNLAETHAYLDWLLRSQTEIPRMMWELAMIRREDHELVGACDLTLDNEREADLGYILARDAWGYGYATEAARAMVDAGFKQLNLERIYAICDVGNSGSAHVLSKVGLRHQSVLHHHTYAKDRWWDVHLYEVTRAEWLEWLRLAADGSAQMKSKRDSVSKVRT